MGLFPKIDRPCPYADRLASVMDGDFCRMCQRTVTDLDAMDTRERRAFLKGCGSEEVCVTYRIKPALAAVALMAAMGAAAPAMAQDTDDDEAQIVVTGGFGHPLRYSNNNAQPVIAVSATDILGPDVRPLERIKVDAKLDSIQPGDLTQPPYYPPKRGD